MTIFLPILLTGPQFGVAVPQYDVPAGIYYNYAADDCLQSDSYWPMIWDYRYTWGEPGIECAGKPLLMLNEPELGDQADMTPAEGAALLWEWRDWQGPLYCCGNGYDASGLAWFVGMMDLYPGALPIDGIHLHAYTVASLDRAQLRKWRELADTHGWDIVATEVGLFPTATVSAQDIADALPELLDTVQAELRPIAVFWFGYRVHPDTLFGGFQWDKLTLHDFETGESTVVGDAWERYTHKYEQEMTLWQHKHKSAQSLMQ